MITITPVQGPKEGLSVVVDSRVGRFSFFGGFSEEENESGLRSRVGECTPVRVNGDYYLPWHVTAALTGNGSEDSWVTGVSEEELVKELQTMKDIYENSDNWRNVICYANQLTGELVY